MRQFAQSGAHRRTRIGLAWAGARPVINGLQGLEGGQDHPVVAASPGLEGGAWFVERPVAERRGLALSGRVSWIQKMLLRLGLAGSCLALASCGTVKFYSQALRGQQEIFARAQPVGELLAELQPSDPLRRKLELIADIRGFACDELHLPVVGHYEQYADLGREHVVWVVFAAPEFSVEAKTWWYPIVGRVKYRGYFAEADARQEAGRLKKRGHDLAIAGVDAYSTLGWLPDPVLNTFFKRSDAELAELLFHELAHRRVFLPGDTDFNEAFATAVGQEGARRWLTARGRAADLHRYERELAATREFTRFVLVEREALGAMYEAHRHEPPEILRQRKKDAFALMRTKAEKVQARWGASPLIRRWFSRPQNNASLNTLATYYDLVPAFQSLLKRHGGDMPAFFLTVEDMKPLSKKERRAKLEVLPRG